LVIFNVGPWVQQRVNWPGSAFTFKTPRVWFAPWGKILFNSAAENQMANEQFSRLAMGRELEFGGRNLLDPKEGAICVFSF
jgi:hypothetical protein